MPTTPREYLYAALRVASAALPVAGAVVFWRAVSFQGYISALLLLALAAATFLAALELEPRKTKTGLGGGLGAAAGAAVGDKMGGSSGAVIGGAASKGWSKNHQADC